MKETLWNCQHIKKSRLKLWSITNDVLLDLVIVLRRINFKSISSLEENRCRHSCYFCLVVETKQSSGGSGCTLRTTVLFQRCLKNQHPMPSNLFELAVASLFWSSAKLCVIKSFEQPLKLQFFQLLMIFRCSNKKLLLVMLLLMRCFWWTCLWWWRHHFRSTCLQNLFSSDALSFLLVDSIALFCFFRTL